jgi:CubicO group peptidase (beta-lactamase class C family)
MNRNRFFLSLVTAFLFLFSSCHVVRFFIYNFADIKDYKKFPSHPVSKSSLSFTFFVDTLPGKVKLPPAVNYSDDSLSFDKFLEESNTVAFLVIRNDTMIYEKYFNDYKAENIVTSFSMAKSFISALIGIAIDEGKIKNTSEPVTNYLAELKNKPGFEQVTIQNLLDMRSGIKFSEQYLNPFGDVAKYYYGTNLKKYIRKLKIKSPPDQQFEYSSVNTQLLGIILQRAIGKSVSEYLQEKIWQPLGMEYDASWSIDSKRNQTEKAFCCLNARARDFAKFGRLFLNKGNWNGKQIISEGWVKKSTVITAESKQWWYSDQWWHTTDDNKPAGDFIAQGFLGQFLYVYPSKNIIIVRLGKDMGKKVHWTRMMRNIAKEN